MKRFITLLFTLYVVLLQPLAADASYFPETQLKAPTTGNTYQVCSPYITPAASATDIFILNGSSTKTVEVHRIEVAPYMDSGGVSTESYALYAIKRTTANSGGTSVSITPTPCDTSSGAATCSAKRYSANPTTGTSAGVIGQITINSNYNTGNLQPSILYDARITGKPLLLNGTGEGIAVNSNGVSTYTNGKFLITVYIKER